MDPLIFLISLVILPPPLDAGGQNNFLFYGGSLVVSPEGNRSHEVEVRSRQATVHCHVNRFSCQSGACGSVAAASAGKIGGDSFGLTWCLQEFRSRLRLGGGGGTALEIRFPTAVSAADSSGYWIPNTRSSSAAWRMKARLDLGIRSDTGEPNRPPVTTIPPILRTPRNCGRTFRLTVFDADGDRVRCRVPTEDGGWECGLCGLPGGFSLDQISPGLLWIASRSPLDLIHTYSRSPPDLLPMSLRSPLDFFRDIHRISSGSIPDLHRISCRSIPDLHRISSGSVRSFHQLISGSPDRSSSPGKRRSSLDRPYQPCSGGCWD